MKTRTNRRTVRTRLRQCIAGLAFLTGFLAAGCGGGGGSPTTTGGTTGGTGTTTGQPTGAATSTPTHMSIGTIDAKGSITVNGIKFDTSGAALRMDDNPNAGEGSLRVGQRVLVRGDVEDAGEAGEAVEIEFDAEIEGPITRLAELQLGRIEVMGQTVLLNDLTLFEDVTAATLAVGQVVEVSGFVDAQGRILARLIELEAEAFEDLPEEDALAEIRGFVENLTATTFTIRGLTIDFAGAVLDEEILEAGGLRNGLFVEAKAALPAANGILTAAEIELEEEALVEVPQGLEIEIEGLITAFTSPQSFSIGGHRVATTAATVFVNGTAANLAVGLMLEVEGTLDANGILVVDEVRFQLLRNVKIEADVTAVDPASGTVTVLGSTGITIFVNADTEIRDKRDDVTPFSLANISAGDRLEIRAFRQNGNVIASRLEREEPGDRVRLQGPVGGIAAAPLSLTILGVTIVTNALTVCKDDVNGEEEMMGCAAFFASLQTGDIVKATGQLQADGTLLAAELELEEIQPLVEVQIEDIDLQDFEFEVDFPALLNGANEVPPVATPAAGSLFLDIDEGAGQIRFILSAQNIVDVQAAHIHFGTPGINGPVILPLFLIARDGPFVSPRQGTLTEADFIAVPGLATFAEALEAIETGGTYTNMHTLVNPGGEIRGQILP